MKKTFVLMVATVALLAGCAQSPQQLYVKPVLDISGERWGQGQAVQVSGSDQRAERVLGRLGGVYGDSATITIGNDLEEAMARAANGLLASKGFVVNSPDPNALQLTVVVEDIRWENATSDQQLGKKIDMTAVLRADAVRGGETFSGRYQTSSEYRSVTLPEKHHNEERLNALLKQTLERMFSDQKLRAFLLSAGPSAGSGSYTGPATNEPGVGDPSTWGPTLGEPIMQ